MAVLLTVSLAARAVSRTSDVDFLAMESLLRWSDVNEEMSVPTWFSVILLFLCAQALWRLADQSAAGARTRWSRHERLLAVTFGYLSIDELTSIHEMSNTPLQAVFDASGAFTFAWVILAMPAVALLGIVFLGYLRALHPKACWLLVLSGAIYVGGALGVELVGASIYSSGGAGSVAYSIATTVEEGMEMLGLVLFLGVVTWIMSSTAPTHHQAGS